jgi:hypothetical protein
MVALKHKNDYIALSSWKKTMLFAPRKSEILIAAFVCGTLSAVDVYGFLYRAPMGTLKDICE